MKHFELTAKDAMGAKGKTDFTAERAERAEQDESKFTATRSFESR
jgi:hypothetical protein